MTQTATQQQQQQKQQQQQAILLALAAVFTGGAGGYILLMTVRGLLMDLGFGLDFDTANWLATMASSPLPTAGSLGVPEGPCQDIEIDHAAAWRAMYLIAAADRLGEVVAGEGETTSAASLRDAMAAEQRYFGKHLEAEARRMRSAALQDMAARLTSDRGPEDVAPLLNWHAVMDERTTFECRQANGYNFRADRMPVIGWPGAVHVKCRCTAGPAVPGAPLMASV